MTWEGQSSAVVIGGSAGSIPVLSSIIGALPEEFPLPIFVCLHRMKNVSEGIKEVLSLGSSMKVVEPDDKDAVLPGHVYVAPSNYHMLISPDYTFCLSTDSLVNFSRPAIDLTFESAAAVYKNTLTGILLTGANKDGAKGMLAVKKNGGRTIVQDPRECSAPFMPLAALELNCVDEVCACSEIINCLLQLSNMRV